MSARRRWKVVYPKKTYLSIKNVEKSTDKYCRIKTQRVSNRSGKTVRLQTSFEKRQFSNQIVSITDTVALYNILLHCAQRFHFVVVNFILDQRSNLDTYYTVHYKEELKYVWALGNMHSIALHCV